jgi:hypothetical protein
MTAWTYPYKYYRVIHFPRPPIYWENLLPLPKKILQALVSEWTPQGEIIEITSLDLIE